MPCSRSAWAATSSASSRRSTRGRARPRSPHAALWWRGSSSLATSLNACDVPTRLARVLYEIAVTYGSRAGNRAVIRWPLTQPELASLAGGAEPTVHRALRELREGGVVSTGYRTITVLDIDKLHRIAYP